MIRRVGMRAAHIPGLSCVLSLLLAAGCGLSVDYDGDPFVASAGGAIPIDDLTGVARLDHLALVGLVARHTSTSSDGRSVYVDYDRVAADPEARFQLDQYLAILAAVNPSSLDSAAERMAYWINGYNAAVIAGVLANYDGDRSFRAIDIPFFDALPFTFGGTALSLNQLEHGVIRGDLDCECLAGVSTELLGVVSTWHEELWEGVDFDPRFHAALNCSAIGCPNLLARAPHVYRADLLDEQLGRAVVEWLDDPDKGAGPNGLSQIFDWYRADFVRSHGSVEDFIEAYRTGGLDAVDTHKRLEYDWSLNITP